MANMPWVSNMASASWYKAITVQMMDMMPQPFLPRGLMEQRMKDTYAMEITFFA